LKRIVTALVAISLLDASASSAQNLVEGTEELDFDRPESWAMKFYASLSLLTSMGVPERMGAGTIDLGFEGGIVPQLSDDQRRVGFDGTKLENLNRTRFFGRVRAHIGLPESIRLELAYLPPFDIGGVEPNLFAVGVGRPFAITENFQLGARGYFQFGTIRGDITCGEDEAAAGADPTLNPFSCEAPSNDELRQRVLGGELTAGYVSDGKWRPYAGLALNYLDLEFQVDAVYSGLIDRTLQLTDGTTVSVTGGVNFIANDQWRVTGEAFYSWLSVVRPPATNSGNDGFWNARFLVTYRLR
jgi:hypothetical protein